MRRIAVFMGTRPEAIKLAPVVTALEARRGFSLEVVNTGQHHELIGQVIDLFGIRIHRDLAVMTQNQGLSSLLSRLLERIDGALAESAADMVLAQGDTSTVLAAALAAFNRQVPFCHVEAGLRTGNLRSPFPEEANRVLVSRLATLHFAPTEMAADNLRGEGVSSDQIFVTGNTVIDALFMQLQHQQEPEFKRSIDETLRKQIGADFGRRPFVLITGHRRENLGHGFQQICDALLDLANQYRDYLFIYPVHLNPNVKQVVQRRLGEIENIRLIKPQSYAEFISLLERCHLVLTDSGGVQEEAPSLGKPVLVMRDTTERPEGVTAGTAKLVGADRATIVAEASRLLSDEKSFRRMVEAVNPYGDGKAAQRIVAAIERFFNPEIDRDVTATSSIDGCIGASSSPLRL